MHLERDSEFFYDFLCFFNDIYILLAAFAVIETILTYIGQMMSLETCILRFCKEFISMQ